MVVGLGSCKAYTPVRHYGPLGTPTHPLSPPANTPTHHLSPHLVEAVRPRDLHRVVAQWVDGGGPHVVRHLLALALACGACGRSARVQGGT